MPPRRFELFRFQRKQAGQTFRASVIQNEPASTVIALKQALFAAQILEALPIECVLIGQKPFSATVVKLGDMGGLA